MKFKYNIKDDVLVIEMSQAKIDDAFEANTMLVHVDKDKEPVLVEIFEASNFLKQAIKTLPKASIAHLIPA